MSRANLKKYTTHFISATSLIIGHSSFADDQMILDQTHIGILDNLNAVVSDQYFLAIEINGVAEPEPSTCFVNDNYIKVPITVLKSHGVIIEPLNDNQAGSDPEYVNINDYPWIEKSIDLTKQELTLLIPAYKFQEKVMAANDRQFRKADRQTAGGYFNYDYTANTYWPKLTRSVAGFNEFIYFNSLGVGSFSGILQDNFKKTTNTTSAYTNAIRLETNWTYDHEASLSSFKFGDSVSRPELWGGSVRFAGFQWSTNFDIQPNFATFPLPSMKGQSTIPSTVDVYVNDALSLSKNVDRGPFLLNELPVVTGLGNVSLVTQDILGRRQEVNIPYYATPNLLKPGLQDFSYEAGWLRYGYGLQSSSYKQAMGSLTYRRGILPQWTVGTHAEVTDPIKNIGLTNQILLGEFGLLNQSAAISKSKGNNGSLLALGFNRQAQDLSFGVNNQVTYGKFATIDMVGGGTKAKLTSQVYAGYSMKKLGMLGLSYTERHDRGMPDTRYLTLNYQKQFKERIAVNMYATRSFENRLGDQIGLTLSWQIDNNSSLNSTSQLQRRNSSFGVDYHNDMIAEKGWGYDLIASEGARQHYEGRLNGQSKYTDYAIRGARDGDTNGIEGNVRGAVINLGGNTRMSRYVSDSFGMVKADNLTGTMVYSNNQPVGRIDEDGILMLPRLNAYEDNKLSIDYKDLPIAYTIEKEHISIIPARRAGAIGHFKALKTKTVYVSLTDPTGQHYSPGTEVFEENTQQYCYVGMYGEVCIQIPDDLKQLKFKFITGPSMNLMPDTEESQTAAMLTPDHDHQSTASVSIDIDTHHDPSDDEQDGTCHLGTHQCQF